MLSCTVNVENSDCTIPQQNVEVSPFRNILDGNKLVYHKVFPDFIFCYKVLQHLKDNHKSIIKGWNRKNIGLVSSKNGPNF